MLEEYPSKSNLSRNNFNGACVVSFTDGLDNESANGDDDLSYIHNTLLNRSIMGHKIEFFSIGFTGAEQFSRLQNMKFNEVMEKTSTDSKHFKTSDDFAAIERYFAYIASNLTDRWKIINLYTPQGHNGKKVRWVLRCGEPRPQPKRKPQHNSKNGYFQMTIGGAKPVGDFGDTWGGDENGLGIGLLNKNLEYGGAGLGVTLGLQGKIGIRCVKGLGITISADGFFNGLNEEMKERFQKAEEELKEQYSKVNMSIPKYRNLALMVGVNYEYRFSDAFKAFAGLGMGTNWRWITKCQENPINHYYIIYDFALDYDTKMSFAYKTELGIVLGEHFVVSFGYFNLGAAKVEGLYHYYSQNGETTDKKFHLSKITPKYLTFSVGVRF